MFGNILQVLMRSLNCFPVFQSSVKHTMFLCLGFNSVPYRSLSKLRHRREKMMFLEQTIWTFQFDWIALVGWILLATPNHNIQFNNLSISWSNHTTSSVQHPQCEIYNTKPNFRFIRSVQVRVAHRKLWHHVSNPNPRKQSILQLLRNIKVRS
jgi:hypothetical protein